MQSWKSINMDLQFKERQLLVVSIIISIFTFIILYVPFSFTFNVEKLSDQFFPLFVMAFLSIYPLHKLFHLLLLVILKESFSLSCQNYIFIFFRFQIKVTNPVYKWKYVAALILPFIIISGIFIFLLFLFPEFGHFTTLLLSYHTGICSFDFICLKALINSPKKSLIEENDEGYEILTSNNSNL